jgi:hypothetical protein
MNSASLPTLERLIFKAPAETKRPATCRMKR